MSAQQKQQQQGASSRRDLEADFLFNQHIVRTVGYTAAGFGFGLATSLFFKNKAGMTVFFSGVGAGYGASNFVNDLNQFRKYKSLGQSQGQNQSQRQNYGFDQLERRAGEGLQYAKNQAQQAAGQAQQKLNEGVQNLKDQGRDASNQARNTAENVRDRANEGLQNAKDQARNVAGQARNAADNLQQRASEGVQQAKDKAQNLAGQAKDAAENLQHRASEGVQQAKDKAQNLAGQAKNTADNLQHRASEGLHQAKDKAQNAADHVKNKAQEGAQHAKEQAKQQEEQFRRKIEESVPNRKEQGKESSGGTSRNAGGDGYNRASNEDSQRSWQRPNDDPKQQGDKNARAQRDPNKDSVERVHGQTFQSFDSNSHKEGKAGMIHEIQTNYQENRNKFKDQANSTDRKTLVSQGQDPYFKSETEGIGSVNDDTKSETLQGAHGYKKGVGEQSKKNKVEAQL